MIGFIAVLLVLFCVIYAITKNITVVYMAIFLYPVYDALFALPFWKMFLALAVFMWGLAWINCFISENKMRHGVFVSIIGVWLCLMIGSPTFSLAGWFALYSAVTIALTKYFCKDESV